MFTQSALAAPESQIYYSAPTTAQFELVTSRMGKYQLQFPKSFGNNPFKTMEKLDDLALVRTDSRLLVAINQLDSEDRLHYRPNQKVPPIPDCKTVMRWQQNSVSGQLWDCKLSRQKNYQENRFILLAVSQAAGKAYELVFIIPKTDYYQHLLEAFYTINSFSL